MDSKALTTKQSVSIECEKLLYPYLFQVLRSHFDRGSFRLISGTSQQGNENSASLIRLFYLKSEKHFHAER